MKTLAGATGLATACYLVLYKVEQPIPPATATYDKILNYGLAVGLFATALVMLISRRMWTLRAIGLFFIFMAFSIFFGAISYTRWSGYKTTATGDVVPNTDPGIQEAMLDLSRSLLIVGLPLLLVGLVGWAYGRYHPNPEDIVFGKKPFFERRSGEPRREEDRIKDRKLEMYEKGQMSNG